MRDYGKLTPHTIGITMKEMVRRVILTIRKHQFAFEVSEKRDYDGKLGDMVTSADGAAQEIYVEMIQENFPDFGVVAEEKNLHIDAGDDFEDVYFTVDPLDGTKAFVRMQSHGIGTMIALVYEGEVISAYVGDVMTEEVYGYRPDSDKVHRISEFGRSVELKKSDKDLSEQYIALRKDPRKYSEKAREVVDKFKGITVSGGSIGTHMAKIWKGVVGAMLIPPHHETPWDSTPILGISKKMGFDFYKIEDGRVSTYDMKPHKDTWKRDFEMIVAPEGLENILNN